MTDYPNALFRGATTDASAFTVTVQWETGDAPGVSDAIIPGLYAALMADDRVSKVTVTTNEVVTTDATPTS